MGGVACNSAHADRVHAAMPISLGGTKEQRVFGDKRMLRLPTTALAIDMAHCAPAVTAAITAADASASKPHAPLPHASWAGSSWSRAFFASLWRDAHRAAVTCGASQALSHTRAARDVDNFELPTWRGHLARGPAELETRGEGER